MIETRYPIVRRGQQNEDESYGEFIVEPLDRGYGITLGNAPVSYTHLAARTFQIGDVKPEVEALVTATKQSFYRCV